MSKAGIVEHYLKDHGYFPYWKSALRSRPNFQLVDDHFYMHEVEHPKKLSGEPLDHTHGDKD